MNKIMHVVLPIGNSSLLTGSDVPNALGKVSEDENRSKIKMSADTMEEGNSLFDGLSNGGTVECPSGIGPRGSIFGSFRDRYGIEWMIEYLEKQTQKTIISDGSFRVAPIFPGKKRL